MDDDDDGDEPTTVQPRRFAWTSNSVLHPDPNMKHDTEELHEIWQHPTMSMEKFHDGIFETGHIPIDIIPMQAIVYDETSVTGIEVLLVPHGKVSNAAGDDVREIKRIIGIRICLAYGTCEFPWSSVGDFPSSDEYQHMYGQGYRNYIQRFDIDGPGDECLISIGAEISQGLKAISFKTNKGRERIFGEMSGNNNWHWHHFPMDSSRRMVGFVCGFATIGYPRELKQNTRLTCITALSVER